MNKVTKSNLEKGKPWRFGENWPGQRCLAKTRAGGQCQRPAKIPVGRCALHGAHSTGPKTLEGKARLVTSKLIHGSYTKSQREKAQYKAAVGREVRREIKAIETWALDIDYLRRNWRNKFR